MKYLLILFILILVSCDKEEPNVSPNSNHKLYSIVDSNIRCKDKRIERIISSDMGQIEVVILDYCKYPNSDISFKVINAINVIEYEEN